MIGSLLSEGFHYFRASRERRNSRKRLAGHLVGTFYELQSNTLLARDLEKFHIRANADRTRQGLIARQMLERLRDNYDDIDSVTVKALESSYSALTDLSHLIFTGKASEHEKWTKEATQVVAACDSALRHLRSELQVHRVVL